MVATPHAGNPLDDQDHHAATSRPGWRGRLRCWSWDPLPLYLWMVRLFIHVVYRPKIEGVEHIPSTGAVIIIANHVSYLDGLLLTAIIKRPVRFVIYRSIYELPVVHYFMSKMRCIPIFPKREEVEKALNDISTALRQGEAVGIFPEGQITYTGHLGRFKPGIESIFAKDPVTVVPIAIHGLWGSVFSRKYLHSKWRWLPRSWGIRARVVVGWPIAPEKVRVDALQRITLKMLERADKLSLNHRH